MPDDSLTKILLIDDDEDDVFLFKNVVNKIPTGDFSVDRVSTYEDAHREIAKGEHDVYVIDYRLGAHNGTELLKEFDVIQLPQPFIMLTGAADGAVEKEAMELGAADYLVKGSFDEQLLSRVLSYSIQRKSMESQRIEHLLEVNRSKDEFIAVASHELRTPATAVKQYIGMVIEGFAGELGDNQRSFLQRAYDSNERQLRIIDDILRVARLDVDKLSLHMVELDVTQIVKGVIKDILPLAKKRQQTINFEDPTSPLLVMADEMYLRMAIANIIDNASKYSEEGKTITIDQSVEDGQVYIRVHDNGVGIAEKDMEKLFVKFSRIHNPLSIMRGGTGLGLYWSKEILNMHDGDIAAEARPGRGMTFTLHLPSVSKS